MLRGVNTPCVQQNPETPQRLRQNCVWVSPEELWSVVDSCRDRNSVCNRLGYGIGLWMMLPLTPLEPPELTQDWGNRLLEGTNRTFCALGPMRKKQWPHKRLRQTFPWESRRLQQRHGSTVACYRVSVAVPAECSSACMTSFEGGHIIFITSMIVWSQVKYQGGINRKLD